MKLRQQGDYGEADVSEVQVIRALTAARQLVHAIAELRQLILERFPAATFTVGIGDDPEGIYLVPIVDIDDLDEVDAAYAERLLEMQVEEGLPVYVVPDWPEERVRAQLNRQKNDPAWRPPPILTWASD